MLDSLICGDCLIEMPKLAPGSVDLVFADPPFNINYTYDVYKDCLPDGKYIGWTEKWGAEVKRILKPNGTFWLSIGDEFAAELKVLFTRKLGFICRSWVVWYYTFGVNCKTKFNRSHAHLFHFVLNDRSFTFNPDAIRVPSARQLIYNDKRAVKGGRMPDDTWILRPQDIMMEETDDVWYFPRVCGTFKERTGFHTCQMPEALMTRIIAVSSNQDDIVLDPFAGSGTTLVVAKRLGRRWLGYELSPEYAAGANLRISNA